MIKKLEVISYDDESISAQYEDENGTHYLNEILGDFEGEDYVEIYETALDELDRAKDISQEDRKRLRAIEFEA